MKCNTYIIIIVMIFMIVIILIIIVIITIIMIIIKIGHLTAVPDWLLLMLPLALEPGAAYGSNNA